MKYSIMLHFIWVFTVKVPVYGVSRIQRFIGDVGYQDWNSQNTTGKTAVPFFIRLSPFKTAGDIFSNFSTKQIQCPNASITGIPYMGSQMCKRNQETLY